MLGQSLLSILVLGLSLSVLAQENAVSLEVMEVVGNKEGRTMAETPESVTILPPSRLNRGDQSNSLEVLNGQSNVQVTRNAENFSIRGVNSTGVTGFQKDNLASVFVDDVFQTDLAMRAGGFEVWDIESLEVHRGPQSTSQGVNSLAGAILLQHTAPHQDNEASLKLGYGSYNRREIGGIANRAFFNKKLAVRLTFNKDANDGFIKNKTTGNSKWGRQDKGHLVGDFKYFFDDKSTLRFNNKFLRTDNGGNYTLGGSNPFKYEVFEDQDYRTVTNNQQNSLQYARQLSSDFGNKTTFAFTKGIQNNSFDADGTRNNVAGTRFEFARDQFMSFENILTYKTSKVKNALGLHAHQFSGYNKYDMSLLFSANTPIKVHQDIDKNRETYAIFDSLLYKLNDNHALNLGARYEFVKNSYGTFVNPTATGVPSIDNILNRMRGAYDGKQDTQVFLPKVGYLYQRNDHTWGLTYTQGYRIGGLDINRAKAKAVEYDPEHTSNYEASWKFTTAKLKTQANIFYTHWKEQQVEVRLSADQFDTQVQNASTSELYGGELESVYSFSGGDTLRLGVGHVKTQFLGFNNNGRSYNGNQFPDAAQWTAQTAWGHFFNDKISSNMTLRHVGKSYTNAENTFKAPAQFYLDGNLQYSGSNYVWEFNAKNLSNQRYLLSKAGIYQQYFGNYYKRVNRPLELGTRITWFW